MGRNPEKEGLRKQCEALGIVLSAKVAAEDFTAALDAYARGFTAGCEKSYHAGVQEGRRILEDETWIPRDWPDAEQRLGHDRARQKFPTLYSEFKRVQREDARRRG